MTILIALALIFIIVVFFFVEFLFVGTEEFTDKRIAKRFLWLWLPFYALWRLSKEVFFTKK